MAAEAKRGCGYRKVGGLYLVGEYRAVACDRLPFPLTVCPTCGHGIKVGRGFTEIVPATLFGNHENCQDHNRPCRVCDPTTEPAYIMLVGEKFYPTPEDFINEGIAQGFSKRIAQIPLKFKIGETVIYLAHHRACVVREPVALQQAMSILEQTQDKIQPKLLEAEKVARATGIFAAFTPQRIEKLYWQSELDKMTDKEREKLQKRGITPVGIPDGDEDHKGKGD